MTFFRNGVREEIVSIFGAVNPFGQVLVLVSILFALAGGGLELSFVPSSGVLIIYIDGLSLDIIRQASQGSWDRHPCSVDPGGRGVYFEGICGHG